VKGEKVKVKKKQKNRRSRAEKFFEGVWGTIFLKMSPKMRTAVRDFSSLLPQEAGVEWHRRYAAATTLKMRSWSSAIPA